MEETAKCPCCGGVAVFIGRTSSLINEFRCMECPFCCADSDLHIIAAAMKAEPRHKALREALRWERECCSFCGEAKLGDMKFSAFEELWVTFDTSVSIVDQMVFEE